MFVDTIFKVDKKRRTKQAIFLVVGILLFSIYAGLLIPANDIKVGGGLGLSIIMNELTGIKVGTMQVLINLPLFYLGYRYIGRNFIILTALTILVSSFFINNISYIITPVNIGDPVVAAILAGILSGLGIAFILMAGGSTGGLDITGKFLVKKFDLNLPTVFLFQDIVVYVLLWMVFDIKAVMYALILSFVRNKTIKGVEAYLSAYLQCTIIVDNAEELVDAVNDVLHRGSTIIDVEGGYTHQKHRMVILVIQQNELYALRKIINKHSPGAFITVNSVNTIMGNFKEHSYRL